MKKSVSIAFMLCGLLFAVCLVVSNIIEQKTINIGPIEATAGLIIFPISYIINDLITEVWGFRKARLVIWLGFALNFLAVGFFQLSILLPGSENFTHQPAFSLVLGNTLRLSTASFVAFLCGSFLNAYVMSRMKLLHKDRFFSVRAIASTIVGESTDSLIFFSIAFYGILPNHDLLILIFTQMGMKTFYEILILPITNKIVRWLKNFENIDTYDTNISYNPFKITDF